MTQLPHRGVLSVREVAEIRGEDVRTVQRKARTGIYPAQKLPGRTGAYVIDRGGLEEIIRLEAEAVDEAASVVERIAS